MKALSIRQPWAWAILNGGKRVENRDWMPTNPCRRYRGPILLHASGGMTRAEWEDGLATMHAISETHPFPEGLMLPAPKDLPRGGIVGRAVVTDLVHESDSPWFFGPLALVLDKVEPLPFTPFKGALGFFDVPDNVVGHIEFLEAERRVLDTGVARDAAGFDACVTGALVQVRMWH